MIFCGQCGLQIAQGTTHCPRCGTAVDQPGAGAPGEGSLQDNNATVASPSFMSHPSMGQSQVSSPGIPGTPPQPLILRPGQNDYGTLGSDDATSMIEAPFPTRTASNPNMGASYAGNYPAQGQYPEQTYGGGYAGSGPGNTYYPGMAPGYGAPEQAEQQENKKLRAAAMVIIVLGLVFVLIAIVLFAMQQNGLVADLNVTLL